MQFQRMLRALVWLHILVGGGGAAAGPLVYRVPAEGHPSRLRLRCGTSSGGVQLVDEHGGPVLATGSGPVRIQGAPDQDDLLTVDWSAGKCGQPLDITFDGGAGGYDVLSLVGDGA